MVFLGVESMVQLIGPAIMCVGIGAVFGISGYWFLK